MNDWYERLEDYFDGVMNEHDRAALEAEAAADPALAEAMALVRETRERLGQRWAGESADAALRETLKGVGTVHFQSEDKHMPKLRRTPVLRLVWSIAAGVAFTLIAWLLLRPPAHERLYAEYRIFPEAAFTVKSDILADTGLPAATVAFNHQHYQQALEALQKYRQANPANLEVAFFAGLCLLELNQTADARIIFSELTVSRNAWREEAVWYLALCYLRDNNRAKCIETLREIKPEDAHGAEAQVLLDAL